MEDRGDRGRDTKKAKLVIVLKRHPKFNENYEKFQKIREENQKKGADAEEQTKQ